jgi:hypothetical protein
MGELRDEWCFRLRMVLRQPILLVLIQGFAVHLQSPERTKAAQ